MDNRFGQFFYNNKQFSSPFYQSGPVSFSAHLGKTLSKELWSDLEKMGVKNLKVTENHLDKVDSVPESMLLKVWFDKEVGDYILADMEWQPWYR